MKKNDNIMINEKSKLLKRAFTLVELLVVISIIALLLAIMMPSLQKARNLAKAVVCKSQIKYIGLAGILYAEDNEQKLPPAIQSEEDNAAMHWYKVAIPPYLSSAGVQDISEISQKSIFHCPGAPKTKLSEEPFKRIKGIREDLTLTYAINGWNYYYDGISGRGDFLKLSPPYKHALFMDSNGWSYVIPDADICSRVMQAADYHNDQLSVVYADGHVSSIRGPEVKWKSASLLELPPIGAVWGYSHFVKTGKYADAFIVPKGEIGASRR